MYYFAAQHQTRTFRRTKPSYFYLKFSTKFNELSPHFQKKQEVAKIWLNLN